MEKSNSDLIEKICECSDMCTNHISLIRKEMRELRNGQNPLSECAICDGHNYNCPEYSSIEEKNY